MEWCELRVGIGKGVQKKKGPLVCGDGARRVLRTGQRHDMTAVH